MLFFVGVQCAVLCRCTICSSLSVYTMLFFVGVHTICCSLSVYIQYAVFVGVQYAVHCWCTMGCSLLVYNGLFTFTVQYAVHCWCTMGCSLSTGVQCAVHFYCTMCCSSLLYNMLIVCADLQYAVLCCCTVNSSRTHNDILDSFTPLCSIPFFIDGSLYLLHDICPSFPSPS